MTAVGVAREFDGMTAVVVGGSSSLGPACAWDLAEHGASLLLVDEDDTAVQSVVDALRIAGFQAVGRAAAVDDLVGLDGALRSVAPAMPPLRVLVTCHHEVEVGSIEALDAGAWERALRVNLLGPALATRAVLPWMQDGGGAIVHVGSVDGLRGNPQVPAYSVSKGGLTPLTHVSADELAHHGIRVNCVARAAVGGRGTGPGDKLLAQVVEATPLGRAAAPGEVAAAVRYLASEEASYITGTVLVVDGGRIGITPGTRRHDA